MISKAGGLVFWVAWIVGCYTCGQALYYDDEHLSFNDWVRASWWPIVLAAEYAPLVLAEPAP